MHASVLVLLTQPLLLLLLFSSSVQPSTGELTNRRLCAMMSSCYWCYRAVRTKNLCEQEHSNTAHRHDGCDGTLRNVCHSFLDQHFGSGVQPMSCTAKLNDCLICAGNCKPSSTEASLIQESPTSCKSCFGFYRSVKNMHPSKEVTTPRPITITTTKPTTTKPTTTKPTTTIKPSTSELTHQHISKYWYLFALCIIGVLGLTYFVFRLTWSLCSNCCCSAPHRAKKLSEVSVTSGYVDYFRNGENEITMATTAPRKTNTTMPRYIANQKAPIPASTTDHIPNQQYQQQQNLLLGTNMNVGGGSDTLNTYVDYEDMKPRNNFDDEYPIYADTTNENGLPPVYMDAMGNNCNENDGTHMNKSLMPHW